MPVRLLFGFLTALALIGAGALAWQFQREAAASNARASALDRELTETKSALKKSQERADALAAKAVELDTQLGSVKTRATATETKSSLLNRELASVKTTLTERQQREVALLAEIESLRQQARAVASTPPPSAAAETPLPVQQQSPAVALPQTPPTPAIDVEPFQRRIVALEAQLTDLLTRALAEPAVADAATPSAPDPAPTPTAPSPAYQVVRVGPRDAFVVLDYGSDHGATSGEFATLARGTSEVGRVQISDVRPRFSVAQVVSPPRKGQLQTGDIVLLAK